MWKAWAPAPDRRRSHHRCVRDRRIRRRRLAPALVLLRLLTGAGEAMVLVGAATMITDLAPEHRRGEALSLFSLGLWGGLALGPILGELVLGDTRFDTVWVVAARCRFAAGAVRASCSRRPRRRGRPGQRRPDGSSILRRSDPVSCSRSRSSASQVSVRSSALRARPRSRGRRLGLPRVLGRRRRDARPRAAGARPARPEADVRVRPLTHRNGTVHHRSRERSGRPVRRDRRRRVRPRAFAFPSLMTLAVNAEPVSERSRSSAPSARSPSSALHRRAELGAVASALGTKRCSWSALRSAGRRRRAVAHRDVATRRRARPGVTRGLRPRRALGCDEIAVPVEAGLRHALERVEADVDDPEALRVLERPLEVVEQGPEEVAPERHALPQRVGERADVTLEVRDPLRVGDASVPTGVLEGGAVLGDVQVGQLVLDAASRAARSVRTDRPPSPYPCALRRSLPRTLASWRSSPPGRRCGCSRTPRKSSGAAMVRMSSFSIVGSALPNSSSMSSGYPRPSTGRGTTDCASRPRAASRRRPPPLR